MTSFREPNINWTNTCGLMGLEGLRFRNERDLRTWFTNVIYERDLRTWFTNVIYESGIK